MRIKQSITFFADDSNAYRRIIMVAFSSFAINGNCPIKSALPISLCGFCIHPLQYMLSFQRFVAIALIAAPINCAIVSKLQRTNQICPFLLSL